MSKRSPQIRSETLLSVWARESGGAQASKHASTPESQGGAAATADPIMTGAKQGRWQTVWHLGRANISPRPHGVRQPALLHTQQGISEGSQLLERRLLAGAQFALSPTRSLQDPARNWFTALGRRPHKCEFLNGIFPNERPEAAPFWPSQF